MRARVGRIANLPYGGPIITVLAVVPLLFAAAACGGDDDDDTGNETATTTETATTPEVSASAREGDGGGESGGGAEGTVVVVVDGEETTLGVDECTPPNGTGPILVLATNGVEDASFSAAGIAGTVTAEFNKGGEQWIAVGAMVEVDGDTFSFEGDALKTGGTPPDAEMSFEVTC